MSKCPVCGQETVQETARRDPPLPALPAPNLVTIHDLPADHPTARVQIINTFGLKLRKLVIDGGGA